MLVLELDKKSVADKAIIKFQYGVRITLDVELISICSQSSQLNTSICEDW